uniref:Uncharacterized protein n=1 Tax=Arundo donax TaxID=35708 RepID=A0A0A8YMJ3_ARUDO
MCVQIQVILRPFHTGSRACKL